MTDRFHQPFSLAALVEVLNHTYDKVPDAKVGRSRDGTGNLCVYAGGDYVGVIELHDPPELVMF